MVSIVLLTTEEVLQRNGFWYCLDTIWITQEMEPFEEVKPEHVYTKPLSRDIYYAKFPDIPRSESEDENSLTVKGFIDKHREWKSKITIRKLDSRRNSLQSNLSVKSDVSNNLSTTSDVSKKVKASIIEENTTVIPKLTISNDERIHNFFTNLLQSIPPPPIEDVSKTNCSIMQPQTIKSEISHIDLPDYADFESHCVLQSNETQTLGPATSTLKKTNYKTNISGNSFKIDADSEQFEWYETIYGVSELIESQDTSDFTNSTHRLATTAETDDVISWSEIVEMCDLTESILDKETLESEKVISHSHYINDGISDLSDSEEEGAYTKFVSNKLRQSLKHKGGIPDSSSIENLNCENEDLLHINIVQNDSTFYKTFYRLAPDEDLVNV